MTNLFKWKWNKVEDNLPEPNIKVIAIFDVYYPAHPLVNGKTLHSTKQFTAYINENSEWFICAPVISYDAKKYGMIATQWMPEIEYPKEVLERNTRYFKEDNSRIINFQGKR